MRIQQEDWKMAEGAEVKKYLEEGRKHVERGDPVQASEKLYKAAARASLLLNSDKNRF